MADPILTDFFRVLAVFHHESGLPEDLFVNSWCFRNDGATDISAVANNIVPVLDAFYMVGHDTTNPVMSYMSNTISEVEYRVYDMGQQPPRVPEIRQPVEAWAPGSGQTLPFETAVCLSFVATRNQPRSRGRLYIGPLKATAVDTAQSVTRPSKALRDSIAAAAENVLGTTENVTWCLVSQADAQAKEVTGGWVDDAWDTQRRRGLAPTERVAWGSFTS